MDGFYEAAQQLPSGLADLLCRVPMSSGRAVTEIRLRSGRPVALSCAQQTYYLQPDGQLTQYPGLTAIRTTPNELAEAFSAVCGHSVHTAQRSVDQGFVSLSGGHRVGVCGTAFWRQDGSMGVGTVTSINIRIARFLQTELPKSITDILDRLQPGILFAGEPGSGKTTVLRSAAAYLSRKGRRVAIVDERCELAPAGVEMGVGKSAWNWDVLSGYPKDVGMMHALRGLGPDVIVCDEIGGEKDVQAVIAASNAGAGVVAAIHGTTMQALAHRPQYRQLLSTGAFTQVVFLTGRDHPGAIREVLACNAVL